MKIFAALFLSMLLSHQVHASETWLHGLPVNWTQGTEPTILERGTYLELPVSIFESAEYQLREHPAIKQSEYAPGNFRRDDLVCPAGTDPYLIRAVYSNGATGGYHLQRAGTKIWVAHQSLGRSTGNHRSALLACLDFEPTTVYVTAGGAM